jgi:hypothetical protein
VRDDEEAKARMADAVRQIVTRRERAPRSPRMERALKRLIWRYVDRMGATETENGEENVEE